MRMMVHPLGVKSRYKWFATAFVNSSGNSFGSAAFGSHGHCSIKVRLGSYSVGVSYSCSVAKRGG